MSDRRFSTLENRVQGTMQAIVAGVDAVGDDQERCQAVLDIIAAWLTRRYGLQQTRFIMREACTRLQDDAVADEVRSRL